MEPWLHCLLFGKDFHFLLFFLLIYFSCHYSFHFFSMLFSGFIFILSSLCLFISFSISPVFISQYIYTYLQSGIYTYIISMSCCDFSGDLTPTTNRNIGQYYYFLLILVQEYLIVQNSCFLALLTQLKYIQDLV